MTTPPIIGAAMRFMTSAPACVTGDHMIGSRPKRIAQTVMIFGLTRPHRAFDHGVVQIAHRVHSPFGFEFFPSVIEIEQHDDTGLGVESSKRDESNPNGDAHIVAEDVKKPERADQARTARQATQLQFSPTDFVFM